MRDSDEKGGGIRLPDSKFNRDDTPSVIQNVERLTSIPSRASMANLPVLEMPRSQRIWRRIRIPFFVTVVVLLLLTVAIITHRIKVATTIASTIEEALALESFGTVEQTRLAEKLMAKLYEKHSGDDSAAAAWAWQTAIQNILFEEPLSEEAKEVLEDVDDDVIKPYAYAARAAKAYIDGDLETSANIVKQGLAVHADDPRISLIEILTMNAAGDSPGAWNRLLALLETQKGYVPLLITGATMAVESGNRLDALDMAKGLLTISQGNLFGEMLMIHLGLPVWGDEDVDPKQFLSLQKKYGELSTALAAAPPKLKIMGAHLRGRLQLLAGHADDAIKSFTVALNAKKDPETLAWMGRAVRLKSNAQAALKILDAHKNVEGPPVYDIRAQLLLEYHRVNQAKIVLDKLEKSGALKSRLQYLTWLYAIRSGDVEKAKATMPQTISGEQKWPALEMYFLLKQIGDTEGITALTKALESEWSTCARVIRSWHSRSLKRATRLFGNKRIECADHLMPRLMSTHADAELIAQAAEITHTKSKSNPVFEIDRARAVWRFTGHAAGTKILDRIAALNPEGVPILQRLASAYIEMDLPDKALAVLGKSEAPNLLALRILAHENAKQKKAAQQLIATAISKSDKTPHPALVFFKLRKLYRTRNLEPIKAWFETEFNNKLPGEWTSEIVELGARALLLLDMRPEAEDLVEKAAKHLLVPTGADEAIETWAVDVGININRGGRHRNRALVIIRTLREEGVMDPRFSYWLGVENIVNGSERLGLKFIKEALSLDGGFRQAWAKMAEMEWMGEQTAIRMRNMRPSFNPPGAPPSVNYGAEHMN